MTTPAPVLTPKSAIGFAAITIAALTLAGCQKAPTLVEQARTSMTWDVAECRDGRTGETFRYRREDILSVSMDNQLLPTSANITIRDEQGYVRTANSTADRAIVCRDGAPSSAKPMASDKSREAK